MAKLSLTLRCRSIAVWALKQTWTCSSVKRRSQFSEEGHIGLTPKVASKAGKPNWVRKEIWNLSFDTRNCLLEGTASKKSFAPCWATDCRRIQLALTSLSMWASGASGTRVKTDEMQSNYVSMWVKLAQNSWRLRDGKVFDFLLGDLLKLAS